MTANNKSQIACAYGVSKLCTKMGSTLKRKSQEVLVQGWFKTRRALIIVITANSRGIKL